MTYQGADEETYQGDDEEICALRAEYSPRWHVTRVPYPQGRGGYLDAAREPGRKYHIAAPDAGTLAESIARYERDGYLVR